MNEEELKQKCKERAKIFQQAMESCNSSSPIDCIEWFADRIAELEAQIEKMKCCENCAFQLVIGGVRDSHCVKCNACSEWKLAD